MSSKCVNTLIKPLLPHSYLPITTRNTIQTFSFASSEIQKASEVRSIHLTSYRRLKNSLDTSPW